MPIKVLRERRVARRQKTQDKKRIKVVEEKKIPVLVPGDYKNNKPEGTVYSIMQLETGDEETLKELIGKKLILPVKGTSFGRKLVEEKDSLGRRIHSDKKIEGLFFVPVRDPGNPQQDYLGRSVSKRFGPLSEVVIKGAGSPAISQAYEEPGNLSLFFIKKGERYNERKFWGGARLPTLRWTNIQADAIAKELEKSKKENDPILKIAEQHGAGQLPTLFPIALMKPLQIPLSNRPESGWKFIYRKRPGDPEPKGKIVKEAVTPEGDIIYTVHTRRLEPDEFREHGKRINKLYSAREKQALQKLAEKNNKKKFIKSISRRRILKLQKGLEYAKVPKEFREDAGIQIYYCRTALRVSDREEIRKQIANFVDKKEVGNHLIEFLGVYGIFITPEKKLYDMSNKKEITWQEAGEKITQQFAARLGLAGHLVWKKQKKLFTSKHGSAIWEINVTLAGEVVDLDTVYKPKDTSYANDKSFGEKQQGLDRIFELVSIFRGVAVQAGILRKALNVYIDMVGLQNIRELILKQQIDRLPWIVPDTTSKRGAKLGIMKYNFLDPKV